MATGDISEQENVILMWQNLIDCTGEPKINSMMSYKKYVRRYRRDVTACAGDAVVLWLHCICYAMKMDLLEKLK